MITSRTNPLIKNIRALKDKKNRDEQNVFIANGIKLVKEAIKSNFVIKYIVGTSKALSQLSLDNFEVVEVSEDVFSSISEEVSPQGVLAIIEKPQEQKSNGKNCILLDGVSDPTNVGAIIRTACASNFIDLFLIDSADPFNSKSVRASMGGIFKIHIHYTTRERAKEDIKLPFVVADMYGEDVFSFKRKEEVCLVIGNEGNGVSKEIKCKAEYTVSIPMQNDMESLNASVSAGILMYLLK